jgi:hypothetical protein
LGHVRRPGALGLGVCGGGAQTGIAAIIAP